MKRRSLTTSLVLSIVATAALADSYDPLQIPAATFHDRVDVIAMWPLEVPHDLPRGDDLRRDFEERIAANLEASGFSVIGSDVVRAKWIELSRQLGGVFDPRTGERIEERYSLAWEYLFEELELSHDVDAVLTPDIRFGSMGAIQGASYWAMPRDFPMKWGDELLGSSLAARPIGVIGPHLHVFIYDEDGAELYNIRVAIEWATLYHASSRHERPLDDLLTTPAHNQLAVDIALDALGP